MRNTLLLLIFSLLGSIALFGQTASFKLMQYNLTYYKAPSAPCSSNLTFQQKDAEFKKVFDAVEPDILVVNELGAYSDNSAATSVLNNVINTNPSRSYISAAYSNNGFSNITNQIFFDSTQFALKSQAKISNAQNNSNLVRVIDFYRLYHKNGLLKSGDTTFFTIGVAHLKAGSSSDDQDDRELATKAVMNYWQQNISDQNVFFAGDFNVQSANEDCYRELTGTSGTGKEFKDPLGFSGSWHNNSTYALLHTQSTNSSSSGCKSGGGMDDRFDQILVSDAVMQGNDRLTYKINTYEAIGNDGNHFNRSINSGSNSAVGNTVADALFKFSDHLPVVAEFEVDLTGLNLTDLNLSENLRYTNPVEERLKIFTSALDRDLQLSILDLTGKTIYSGKIAAGISQMEIDLSHVTPGVYLLQMSHPSSGETSTKKLVVH